MKRYCEKCKKETEWKEGFCLIYMWTIALSVKRQLGI